MGAYRHCFLNSKTVNGYANVGSNPTVPTNFMRKWIKQPIKPKRCCGHIAVAVIAEISLEESRRIVNINGGTTTKDLITALRKLGFKCPDKCVRTPRPALGLAKMKKPSHKQNWHWVVVDGDKIYDGTYGNSDGTVNWKKSWKITSYLPVTKL